MNEPEPYKCPNCGVLIESPAEGFLHQRVHATPFGTLNGLNKLPFGLYLGVARVMEEYAGLQTESEPKKEGSIKSLDVCSDVIEFVRSMVKSHPCECKGGWKCDRCRLLGHH